MLRLLKWLVVAWLIYLVYRVVKYKNGAGVTWGTAIHIEVPVIGAFFKDTSAGPAGALATPVGAPVA